MVKLPKIRKNINFSAGEVKAIQILIKAGYNFTETGVVRGAIRDIFAQVFPGKPFPADDEKVGRSP